MTEDQEKYIVSTSISKEEKMQLMLLSNKLRDVAKSIDALSEDKRKFVIERTDKLTPGLLKTLYDSLNNFLGW